jgi:hypothetical protein
LNWDVLICCGPDVENAFASHAMSGTKHHFLATFCLEPGIDSSVVLVSRAVQQNDWLIITQSLGHFLCKLLSIFDGAGQGADFVIIVAVADHQDVPWRRAGHQLEMGLAKQSTQLDIAYPYFKWLDEV